MQCNRLNYLQLERRLFMLNYKNSDITTTVIFVPWSPVIIFWGVLSSLWDSAHSSSSHPSWCFQRRDNRPGVTGHRGADSGVMCRIKSHWERCYSVYLRLLIALMVQLSSHARDSPWWKTCFCFSETFRPFSPSADECFQNELSIVRSRKRKGNKGVGIRNHFLMI